MPVASPQSNRLLLLPLSQEQDIVLCRHRARAFAAALRFPLQEQTRIATAVSEIARNAFCYARSATAEFLVEEGPANSQSLVVEIRDVGPGIANLPAILDGTYRSPTGLGKGIVGAKRLLDRLDITTSTAGTVVRLFRKLPTGVRVGQTEIQKLARDFSQDTPIDPLHELATQNGELLNALADVNTQREELEKINVELSETNRGVVALYDELDTVYRVGRVVAGKLELEPLLQAITDATTEVSGAECGAFYYLSPEHQELICQGVAGQLGSVLGALAPASLAELTGPTLGEGEVLRIDDLTALRSPPVLAASNTRLRSYLAVAVQDSAGIVAGTLVFGHSEPQAFSERTERIIASVAVQASIGLENAQLYQSMKSASAAKDHFLAILSHELRTPLNPVFAILSALEQRDDLHEEVRTDLVVARRNLQLEARLIDDLLDLTRIVKGKVPLHRETVDLHVIIGAALETCHAASEKKHVRVELHATAPRSHILGDPARLQQVFWNLLSNAVKFTPPGGLVRIQTSINEQGEFCVSVSDTGRGISADALPKIFRAFEQGDANTSTQFGGLGLGLAISKSIIDAHQGTILAESMGERLGSTFLMTFPLVETPAPMPTLARTVLPVGRQRPLGILLVDDHEDTRETLKRLLSRRGHSITMAANCAEARDAASVQGFDLLISDLGLPDGSGHDLMRELHEAYRLRGIALSGFGMETDIQRSHAAGFCAHLTKPLDFAVLETTIALAVCSDE